MAKSLQSQEELAKNSWLLKVNLKENYLLYFQADTSEPDEFIEGGIFLYDILKATHERLIPDTYIFDFLTIQLLNDDSFLFSDGSSIKEYTYDGKVGRTIFNAIEGALINSFSISNDHKNLLVNMVDLSLNNHKVLVYDIESGVSRLIHEEHDSSIGERLHSSALISFDNTVIYLLNISGDLVAYNALNGASELIETGVNEIFALDASFIYYSKKTCLIEYDVQKKSKLEVIESDNVLDISFLNIYKEGIFVVFNDNPFVYNKNKQTFKKVEGLPKNRYVYFSKSLAITRSLKEKTLSLYRNEN